MNILIILPLEFLAPQLSILSQPNIQPRCIRPQLEYSSKNDAIYTPLFPHCPPPPPNQNPMLLRPPKQESGNYYKPVLAYADMQAAVHQWRGVPAARVATRPVIGPAGAASLAARHAAAGRAEGVALSPGDGAGGAGGAAVSGARR